MQIRILPAVGVETVKCEYRVNGLTGRFQLNASDIISYLKKVRKTLWEHETDFVPFQTLLIRANLEKRPRTTVVCTSSYPHSLLFVSTIDRLMLDGSIVVAKVLTSSYTLGTPILKDIGVGPLVCATCKESVYLKEETM